MTDFITSLITDTGYLGIFGLMVLENVFPPIPSEVIMPFAGFVAAGGSLNPFLVILAGSIGTLIGTLPWWYLGHRLPTTTLRRLTDRFGVYLSVSTEDFDRATAFFARFQRSAVLLGRLVPGIRTVISLPAGSIGMHFPTFIILSAIGTIMWNSALVGFGYVLKDQYEHIGVYIDPVTTIIIAVILGLYIFRIIRQFLLRRKGA